MFKKIITLVLFSTVSYCLSLRAMNLSEIIETHLLDHITQEFSCDRINLYNSWLIDKWHRIPFLKASSPESIGEYKKLLFTEIFTDDVIGIIAQNSKNFVEENKGLIEQNKKKTLYIRMKKNLLLMLKKILRRVLKWNDDIEFVFPEKSFKKYFSNIKQFCEEKAPTIQNDLCWLLTEGVSRLMVGFWKSVDGTFDCFKNFDWTKKYACTKNMNKQSTQQICKIKSLPIIKELLFETEMKCMCWDGKEWDFSVDGFNGTATMILDDFIGKVEAFACCADLVCRGQYDLEKMREFICELSGEYKKAVQTDEALKKFCNKCRKMTLHKESSKLK